MRFHVKLLALTAFLLYAFQCGNENVEPEISEPPVMNLSVTPNVQEISVGDTLWLSGETTSKVLHYQTQDSIIWQPNEIFLYIYRLKVPLNAKDQNTVPAALDFSYHAEVGKVEKEDYSGSHAPHLFSHYDSLHRIITPAISYDSSKYIIKIGIIPDITGVFALYSNPFTVANFHRNLYEPYGDLNSYSFYFRGRIESGWWSIGERIYFFEVK